MVTCFHRSHGHLLSLQSWSLTFILVMVTCFLAVMVTCYHNNHGHLFSEQPWSLSFIRVMVTFVHKIHGHLLSLQPWSLAIIGYYTYTRLFQSGVCPILDYGSEIWGFRHFDIVDSIQNKAIRIYLGFTGLLPLQ